MGRTGRRAHRLLLSGTVVIAVCLFLATLPAGAGAFDISSFSLDPSSKQAAAHPDLKVSVDFSTGPGEDVRDLTLDFPPGLIGNPETKSKCSQATFTRDGCPAASRIGNAAVVARALGLPVPVSGTVYVLRPSPGDAATLGVVLRPTGGVPLVGKVMAVAHVTVERNDGGDYFLRNTIRDLPTTALAVGLVPVPITLERMTLDLSRFGNAPGSFFLTNPTSCEAATATVRAVSYQRQTASAQSSYTPTDCTAVPFNPSLAFSTTSTQAGAKVGASSTLALPADERPLRQSHVKTVLLKLPPGLTLDIGAAFGATICSDASFGADECPVGSDIGDALAAVPPLPPDFTGDLYRIAPSPGYPFGFGVLLRGPRGVKATLRGGAAITSVLTPEGYLIQLVSSFSGLPQIPFTSFSLSITRPIFFNSRTCGTRNAEAEFGGWSGASANVVVPYTTTGC